MPEYIDRDHYCKYICRCNGDKCEKTKCPIFTAPTADVAPVVHGEWIYHEMVSTFDGMMSGYSCSECCTFVSEEMFDYDEFPKDICGFCGAKMDGGKK